jgi:tetratricopeptide (TPR) repeat protein
LAENNLANVVQRMGDWPRALQMAEHALATREKAYGPDHPEVAQSLHSVGLGLMLMGDEERAVSVLERCAAIIEKTMGRDRRELSYPLGVLGRARVRLHQFDGARDTLDRALALAEQPGGLAEMLADPLLGQGELAIAQARPQAAIAPLERGMTIATPDDRAYMALTLAEALWSSKTDPARGRALAEEARVYFASIGHRPGDERATRWLAEHP